MANELTFSLDDLEAMDWTFLEENGPDQDQDDAPGIFDSALGYRLATVLGEAGTGDLMAAAPRLAAFTAWSLPILRKLLAACQGEQEAEDVFRMMIEAAEAALENARVSA